MGGERLLVIGYGNPGRGDDGLGPALAERIDALALQDVTVEIDYQLGLEHALEAAQHELVLFADATCAGEGPFALWPVGPDGQSSFSTHSQRPGEVLATARALFEQEPEAFCLGIRGSRFEAFREGLSEPAAANLEQAFIFLLPLLAGPGRAARLRANAGPAPIWEGI